MKRSLIFVLALMSLVIVPANAAVSVEESTDAEYLMNEGYSQLMAEDVFMQKNRVQGKPIEPLYDRSHNRFVNACRKIYAYIDPSIDTVDRIHHDIKPSPSISDL